MKELTYDQIFMRNIGVFTEEEQQRIKSLRILVAGVGGLGGPVAHLLARLGVGYIRLMDPDIFEASNINRQYGAYSDTLGRNKAEVIGEEIMRIHRFVEVDVIPAALNSSNAKRVVSDINVSVNGIDFTYLGEQLALHEESYSLGLNVYAGQGAGEINSSTCFAAGASTFKDLIMASGQLSILRAIQLFFPILPKEATPELIEDISNGKLISIPSYSIPYTLDACFLVQQLIRVEIKDLEPLAIAPDIYSFNMDTFEGTVIRQPDF